MIKLQELDNHTNKLLEVEKFKDYAPNGLQVQGRPEIENIVTGVSATKALIEAAIRQQADAIIVHHGWFWKHEDPRIIGMKYARLRLLMQHDISLLGYHLPLDAHPEIGNNAQLAKLLDFVVDDVMDEQGVGNIGHLENEMPLGELGEIIEAELSRKPLIIRAGDHPVKRIAWCSGGAQDWISQAVEAGVDAFMSGEISEHTVHTARENGVHYIAAGHHATERYGVKALGEHLAGEFEVECEFIDIDNPA